MIITYGKELVFKNTDNDGAKILVLYFILYPIMMIVKEYFNYWYFIFAAFFGIMIWIHIPRVSRNYKRVLAVWFILVLFCCFSLLREYMTLYLYNWNGMCAILFLYCMPWLLLTITETKWDIFSQIVGKKTILMFITSIILFIHDWLTEVSMNGNMGFSYAAMPVVIFSLYDFFNTKKIHQLIIAITMTVMIVLFGSRGPLLCIGVFVLLYFAKSIKRLTLMISFISGILIYISVYFYEIINWISKLLEKYNIYSRTIYKIITGSILDGTGRDRIQNIVIGLIKSNPILGVGIGGERVFINQEIYNMSKNMGACYPHNFALEVFAQYGLIIGFLIILFILYKCIYIYIYEKEKRDILIFFISITMVRLMLSSSYLEDPMFFAFLGFILNVKGKGSISVIQK